MRNLKKSIITVDLSKEKKESEDLTKEISLKEKEIEKIKKVVITSETEIEILEEKIFNINSKIQKQTGLEQEALNREISNLRAELAGLSVKKENHEKKLKETERKKIGLQSSMEENEVAIKNLRIESPTIEKIQNELSIKKKELEKLEELRKKQYMRKSELRDIEEKIEDKKNLLQNYITESNLVSNQVESLSSELFDKKTDDKKVEELGKIISRSKNLLINFEKKEREIERIITINNSKIEEHMKIIEKIGKLDICPLCKSKITKDHTHSIREEATPRIRRFESEISSLGKEAREIFSKKNSLRNELDLKKKEVQKRKNDLRILFSIKERNVQLKNLQENLERTNYEIAEVSKNKKKLEDNFEENLNLEERYETLKMDVEEISLRNKENLSSEISFKQRDLERAIISLKQLSREKEDLMEDLEIIEKNLSKKEKILKLKRKEEEELTRKAKRYIEERDSFQQKIRETESDLSERRNAIYNVEQLMNNLKVERAKKEAEVESLEMEILEFPGAEIIKSKKEILMERLRRAEETLIRIGTVNMRALEVYDEIKKEYESIREKVEIITREKEEVLKIIHEIDIKKKKAFIKTLRELSEILTRNFSQISTKGQIFLELQNKKDPFEGGVDVIVKTGHGKYFDIKSLSGGEQTMVALSLIFAIQELKPYCFYILDEIDAALDKRNSERLSGLLKKYMLKGQYIIITHNDEVITGATNLFGVSMHEGLSKIISLKV